MKTKTSAGRYVIYTFLVCLALLTAVGLFNYIVDPYYHYRALDQGQLYAVDNERYANDGIIKHYDYDSLITGSSMTENFKASQFDDLFGVHSIKVPFFGATYKEINDNLTKAFQTGKEIKVVMRGLDYNKLLEDPEGMRYDSSSYPDYLYNDKMLDDIKYLCNREVTRISLYSVYNILRGNGYQTFDDYAAWDEQDTGRDIALAGYVRQSDKAAMEEITTEELEIVEKTFNQNVVNLVAQNPQTQFIFFFTPYSIYYWDDLNQTGQLHKQLAAEKRAYEILLQYPNVRVFSFWNEEDIICDIDRYKDTGHYGKEISDQIMQYMGEGRDEITLDNYQQYCDWEEQYFTNYDYDALFR